MIETAAMTLGTDKSRGYCLEMICADFLAGAHLDHGNPEILLNSIYHGQFRSHSGADSEENLVTLCATCYATVHRR